MHNIEANSEIKLLPSLQLCFIGDECYFIDIATNIRWSYSYSDRNLIFLIFKELERNKNIKDIIEKCVKQLNVSKDYVFSMIQLLKKEGLFVSEENHNLSTLEGWSNWPNEGWSKAALFDWQCHVYPKRNYSCVGSWDEDCEMMRDYLSKEDPPSAYKEYDSNECIFLSNNVLNLSFDENIFKNRGDHMCHSGKIEFSIFSRICFLAFGQTGIKKLSVTGEHITKTSPSGGSRHPTEIYPIIFNVDGISEGLYHYNVRKHALELLHNGDFHDHFYSHIMMLRGRLRFKPSCVFIYTTIPERSMFRYRESRSYKVLHFDVGHLMETVHMIMRACKRPYYSGYSLSEKNVENLIGINGLEEAAIAHTVVG